MYLETEETKRRITSLSIFPSNAPRFHPPTEYSPLIESLCKTAFSSTDEQQFAWHIRIAALG